MPINSQTQHSCFVWRTQKFSSWIVNHITIFQHDIKEVTLDKFAYLLLPLFARLDLILFSSFLSIFSHCGGTTYFLLSVILFI